MPTLDVVTLGETMAQLIPVAAPLERAESFLLAHAGAESNVAVGIARLGLKSGWASRLGRDPLAERILHALATEEVDLSLVIRGEQPTGIFIKDPAGLERSVIYYRKGSAASFLDRTDIERALATKPRLIHLTGITPALSPTCDDAVEYGLVTAKQQGTTTSFDVNYRAALWPDITQAANRLAHLAGLSDVVFIGRDEAEQLWGLSEPAAIAKHLQLPGTLIIKDGGAHASTFTPDGHWAVPALPVDVVESVGAGDAFAAGWLAGMLHGLDQTLRLRAGHLMARQALKAVDDHGEPISWTQLLSHAHDAALWHVPTTPMTEGLT